MLTRVASGSRQPGFEPQLCPLPTVNLCNLEPVTEPLCLLPIKHEEGGALPHRVVETRLRCVTHFTFTPVGHYHAHRHPCLTVTGNDLPPRPWGWPGGGAFVPPAPGRWTVTGRVSSLP